MLKIIKRIYKSAGIKFKRWGTERKLGLFVFNLVVVLLLLLKSAGYFHPFFELSITFIFLISMILAVFLLGARSSVMFFLSTVFLMIALVFSLLEITVWAERTSVYVFESLVLGLLLLFYEENVS